MKLWGEKTNDTISLPELDETTAHTLVHYLYTGRYQALQSHGPGEKGAVPNYKDGACVYCAAIRYKLPGLAELAKEKITSLGEDLTILDILRVSREHAFPLLPEDEAWFPAYLEGAIHGAVTEDPELFTRDEFVDQIEGDRKFRQVVMKAILKSRAPAVSSPPSSAVPMSVTAAVEEEVKLPIHDEAKESDISGSEPMPSVRDDHPPNPTVSSEEPPLVNATVPAESVKLEEIEPTTEPVEAPEPFTDELGFGNSKTYQKMGKKADNTVLENSVVADAATKPSASPSNTFDVAIRPAHTRSDSVMQVEQTVSAPVKEENIIASPSTITEGANAAAASAIAAEETKTAASPEPADIDPVIVDGTSGNVAASKKSRKKKKKSASAGAAS